MDRGLFDSRVGVDVCAGLNGEVVVALVMAGQGHFAVVFGYDQTRAVNVGHTHRLFVLVTILVREDLANIEVKLVNAARVEPGCELVNVGFGDAPSAEQDMVKVRDTCQGVAKVAQCVDVAVADDVPAVAVFDELAQIREPLFFGFGLLMNDGDDRVHNRLEKATISKQL